MISGKAPTASSSGWMRYYQCTDSSCGLYFEDAGSEIQIGGKAALAAWKAEGGRGYLSPITETVDLGLSVKWRSCNLGASTPEDYGGYYQWAGTTDVTDKSIYLDWSNCPYHTGSSYTTSWTKYNTRSSYGVLDNKTVLDLEDDVAYVKLGGTWRMPTAAEWEELRTLQSGSCAGKRAISSKVGKDGLPAALPDAVVQSNFTISGCR